MMIVSKLTKLVHLSHGHSTNNINLKQFKHEFEIMADKCQQLKSVSLCYCFSKEPIELSSITNFRNLKRLLIDLNISESFRMIIFESLNQLTHLTINSRQYRGEPLSETILTDIDYYSSESGFSQNLLQIDSGLRMDRISIVSIDKTRNNCFENFKL